jgi:hypothetical protein
LKLLRSSIQIMQTSKNLVSPFSKGETEKFHSWNWQTLKKIIENCCIDNKTIKLCKSHLYNEIY